MSIRHRLSLTYSLLAFCSVKLICSVCQTRVRKRDSSSFPLVVIQILQVPPPVTLSPNQVLNELKYCFGRNSDTLEQTDGFLGALNSFAHQLISRQILPTRLTPCCIALWDNVFSSTIPGPAGGSHALIDMGHNYFQSRNTSTLLVHKKGNFQ